MSVILGFKSNEKITLAADNKTVHINDDKELNKHRKIIPVNKQLAVAFAGNMAIQTYFQMMIDSFEVKIKEKCDVDDALMCLEKICLRFKNSKKEFARNIVSVPSSFIIAGLNSKEQMIMYSVSYISGELDALLAEIALFTPPDVDFKEWANKYSDHTHDNMKCCIKDTIKGISRESKFVSSTGDIWTYYFDTKNSKMEHF